MSKNIQKKYSIGKPVFLDVPKHQDFSKMKDKFLGKLSRLKTQLDRLNAIGGTKAIVPSEGLVFKYKGKTYKFTGAFAPINQITGLIYF